MFSDELTFKNNSELNRHNYHYWSDINSYWHRLIDNQNRWSVNIWCEIVNGYLIVLISLTKMSIGKTFWHFLRIIHHNYFKTLISKHARDYEYNFMARHLTTQDIWEITWIRRTMANGLDEMDPSCDLHNLLFWRCSTTSYRDTWKMLYMSKCLQREKIW